MTALTFVHTVLRLIGIFSGFVVVFGLLTGRRLDGWTAIFLATTVATSVTGFLFPFHRFLPSYGIGVISLIALAVAIVSRYGRQLAGAWRHSWQRSSLLLVLFVVIGIFAAIKFRNEAVGTA